MARILKSEWPALNPSLKTVIPTSLGSCQNEMKITSVKHLAHARHSKSLFSPTVLLLSPQLEGTVSPSTTYDP